MRNAALTVLILLAGVACASRAEPAQPADATEPAWTSLFDGKTLAGWRPSGFGGDGDATVEDGSIVIPMGERLSGITYSGDADIPHANYEVEIEARRVSGNDFFVGLTFPVADSHASLIVGGWGGSVCGISSLDGEDANHNDTRKVVRFTKGRWYKIRLRVEPTRLRAWLDDEPLIDADTTGKQIGIRPEVGPSRPFGLATFATRAEVRSVRVRKVEGE